MPRFPAGQTLLIDADDTLWENNVYFNRAIEAFIGFLNHREYTPAEVHARLIAIESENIPVYGYGLSSFERSLLDCFERLSSGPPSEEDRSCVRAFTRAIADREIALLPGVRETLADLTARHRLILMTKGDRAEQAGKLARSGLARYFSAIEIVEEKNCDAYRRAIESYQLAARDSWMIGNSPRSDINPALAAGLHAVHLFYRDTWVLEHAELDTAMPGQHLIEIEGFGRLLELF